MNFSVKTKSVTHLLEITDKCQIKGNGLIKITNHMSSFYIVLKGAHNLFDRGNTCKEKREKEVEEVGRGSQHEGLSF